MSTYLKARGAKPYHGKEGLRLYLPFWLVSRLVELDIPKFGEDREPTMAGDPITSLQIGLINESIRCSHLFWSEDEGRFIIRGPSGPWMDILKVRLDRIVRLVELSNDSERVLMTRESGDFELEFLSASDHQWHRMKGPQIADLEAVEGRRESA